MKTLYKRLIAIPMVVFCSMLLFTSCEDFLAEKPYDFYDEQDFYRIAFMPNHLFTRCGTR